jgi:hypothetical protein
MVGLALAYVTITFPQYLAVSLELRPLGTCIVQKPYDKFVGEWQV